MRMGLGAVLTIQLTLNNMGLNCAGVASAHFFFNKYCKCSFLPYNFLSNMLFSLA